MLVLALKFARYEAKNPIAIPPITVNGIMYLSKMLSKTLSSCLNPEICNPEEGMSVYDPTVGSGGMLIQMRDYLREKGGSSDELSLNGQESIGTTWSIFGLK